jgi:hypothetical protein
LLSVSMVSVNPESSYGLSQLLLISSSNMRACDTNRAGTSAVTM